MHNKKLLLMTVVAMLVTMAASQAMALVAPVAGSFGFEAYDFFVNNILKGPFGAIAGVLAIIAGVVVMIQQKLGPAVLCILGGVLVINSDKIVTSLGMII